MVLLDRLGEGSRKTGSGASVRRSPRDDARLIERCGEARHRDRNSTHSGALAFTETANKRGQTYERSPRPRSRPLPDKTRRRPSCLDRSSPRRPCRSGGGGLGVHDDGRPSGRRHRTRHDDRPRRRRSCSAGKSGRNSAAARSTSPVTLLAASQQAPLRRGFSIPRERNGMNRNRFTDGKRHEHLLV